jgi:hypothetical protein
MDPHIYCNGIAVGINCGMYICWFSNAPEELKRKYDERN